VSEHPTVLPVAAIGLAPLADLLARFGLEATLVPDGGSIPGSYWGEPEAGLLGSTVYVRSDTPVHSVLHEACHIVCMTAERRAGLATDAGGDFDEENAVCYLQIRLAEQLPGVGAYRLMNDMDAWGYTFRLGSTRAWFGTDTDAERRWLRQHGIVDDSGQVTFRLRS
jgi:hypothetical protein